MICFCFAAVATYLIPRIFSQIFRVDDLNLLSFAVFFRLLGALTVVFGYRVWHIYFSRTMNCTLGLTAALTRSYLSRNIHEDQLGNVYNNSCLIIIRNFPLHTKLLISHSNSKSYRWTFSQTLFSIIRNWFGKLISHSNSVIPLNTSKDFFFYFKKVIWKVTRCSQMVPRNLTCIILLILPKCQIKS